MIMDVIFQPSAWHTVDPNICSTRVWKLEQQKFKAYQPNCTHNTEKGISSLQWENVV